MASPCKQPPIQQVSTGQAGVEINRDLETLFKAVNQLIRCVSKVADFADAQSGGAFQGGSGSGTSGTGGGGIGLPVPDRPVQYVEAGTGFEIAEGSTGILYINATADIDVEMPTSPFVGQQLIVINSSGAGFDVTLTKSAGAVDIAILYPQSMSFMVAFGDSALAPSWPTVVPVFAQSGIMYLNQSIVLLDSGKGLFIESADASLWAFNVDNAGMLSTIAGTPS